MIPAAVKFFFADAIKWGRMLSKFKRCALYAAEMGIIEEYEKNLQFEQQYISSIVEGMEVVHIICPVCCM